MAEKAAILNLNNSTFFKVHPHLKSHISFYSNGLAIKHGLPNNGHVKVNNGRKAAILNLFKSNFFKMHPLLKPYNLFYSNGVAILSGFHAIRQNISVGFTEVIN